MRIFTLCFILVFVGAAGVFAQIMPKEGLVAYYSFEEGTGTTVVDSSANGLNGEIVGDAAWGDGFLGGGLEFNGIDSYVNCGDHEEFNIEFELTLMAWVYPYDLDDATHDPWISKGDNQYALKNGTGTYFEFFIYDDTWYAPQVALTADDNEVWHHYAGVYDGFELRQYIDGQLMINNSGLEYDEHEGSINTTTYELWLGSNSQASGRYFEGTLDEVAIFNVAFTDEQIAAIYAAYTGGATGVDEPSMQVATAYSLMQNYPNPFNPQTTITYSLPKKELVTLKVYDIAGREVQSLVNSFQAGGTYSVSFDATHLPSGIYFYTLQAGNFKQVKKMTLVR